MGKGKRLRSEVPKRNYIYSLLRSKNTTEEFTDKKGNTVFLNLGKRILFNRPYSNPEYEKERKRMIKKFNSLSKQEK